MFATISPFLVIYDNTTKASINVYGTKGCKLWYSILYNVSYATRLPYNKVYVRLGSTISTQKGLQKIGVVFIVVGLTTTACVILSLALLWGYRRGLITCRKFQVLGALAVYSYAQVKRATRNFSDKLGEGGFGCVFRGIMPGSIAVAVKHLKGFGQAAKQFRAVVQTLGVITEPFHLLCISIYVMSTVLAKAVELLGVTVHCMRSLPEGQ
jgi:hypothetical protein